MEKKTIGIVAAVLGGGCLISAILEFLAIGGIMVGGVFALKSCSDNQSRKIKESENILARFTETALPETLELSGEITLDKQFSTEYMPYDSMYDTVILRNYEIIAYLYNTPYDKIAVTMQGDVLTGEYFQEINYDYHGYLPYGKEKYLACYNYHDDDITFISPAGETICTYQKSDLPDFSEHSDSLYPEQIFIVTQSSSGDNGMGLSDSEGNLILGCEYDNINLVYDDIFFLRKEETSCFYDVSKDETTVTDSCILEFRQIGEAFYAVTNGKNGYCEYTVYAPCKN